MSVCMYKIRPIINNDEMLPPPSHNMYHMRPVLGDGDGEPQGTEHKVPLTVGLGDLPGRLQELLQGSQGDILALQKRQEEILRRLAQLKIDMTNLRSNLNAKPAAVPHVKNTALASNLCQPCPELGETRDVVIYASPSNPPYSLLGLARLWDPCCPLELRSHTHSSVTQPPKMVADFNHIPSGKPCLKITLIWKNVTAEPELIVSPVKHTAIRGEVNILRFLSRVGPAHLAFENDSDINKVTKVDELLDICEGLSRRGTAKKAMIHSLNLNRGNSQWICQSTQPSVVDLMAWSIIKQLNIASELQPEMIKWMASCDSMFL